MPLRNLLPSRHCCLPGFFGSRFGTEGLNVNSFIRVGACEGSLACSTCHVIVQVRCARRCLSQGVFLARKLIVSNFHSALQDPELYARIPEAEDDENDMLDLAYGLTETYAVFWVEQYLG